MMKGKVDNEDRADFNQALAAARAKETGVILAPSRDAA